MWAQMAKIRSIQSDIAKMHVALDAAGIVVDGIKDRKGTPSGAAPLRSANLSAESTMGFLGRNKGPGEAPPPHVSDEEFAKRKDNVNEIMRKVS